MKTFTTISNTITITEHTIQNNNLDTEQDILEQDNQKPFFKR